MRRVSRAMRTLPPIWLLFALWPGPALAGDGRAFSAESSDRSGVDGRSANHRGNLHRGAGRWLRGLAKSTQGIAAAVALGLPTLGWGQVLHVDPNGAADDGSRRHTFSSVGEAVVAARADSTIREIRVANSRRGHSEHVLIENWHRPLRIVGDEDFSERQTSGAAADPKLGEPDRVTFEIRRSGNIEISHLSTALEVSGSTGISIISNEIAYDRLNGGVHIDGTAPFWFIGNWVHDNRAPTCGGLWTTGGSSGQISHNRFVDNIAGDRGSAACLIDSAALIAHNDFRSNFTWGFGTLFLGGSVAHVVGGRFARNKTSGGAAIGLNDGSYALIEGLLAFDNFNSGRPRGVVDVFGNIRTAVVVLQSTIIGNPNSAAVWTLGDAKAGLYNNILQGNGTGAVGGEGIVVWGQNATDLDPPALFVDRSRGRLHQESTFGQINVEGRRWERGARNSPYIGIASPIDLESPLAPRKGADRPRELQSASVNLGAWGRGPFASRGVDSEGADLGFHGLYAIEGQLGSGVQIGKLGEGLGGVYFSQGDDGSSRWLTFANVPQEGGVGDLLQFTGPALSTPLSQWNHQGQRIGSVELVPTADDGYSFRLDIDARDGQPAQSIGHVLTRFAPGAVGPLSGLHKSLARDGIGLHLVHNPLTEDGKKGEAALPEFSGTFFHYRADGTSRSISFFAEAGRWSDAHLTQLSGSGQVGFLPAGEIRLSPNLELGSVTVDLRLELDGQSDSGTIYFVPADL